MSATLCYGQSDTIYYNGSKLNSNILKVTKKYVITESKYDNQKISLFTMDSVYCHTSKVSYYKTGGKELKESMILALVGSGVSILKTEEQITNKVKIGAAVSILVTSTVKLFIGVVKLEQYEPKPTTDYVMLRFAK